MQLININVSINQLEGSLPEAWGNLTNVSPVLS